MQSRLINVLAVCGVAMLAVMPAASIAGQPAEGATKSVVLRNINLHPASDADARRLLAQLDRAAVEACGATQFSLPEVKQAARRSDCWRSAMKQAVEGIGHPQLAAVYQRYRAL